jgi:hypothetical protein
MKLETLDIRSFPWDKQAIKDKLHLVETYVLHGVEGSV